MRLSRFRIQNYKAIDQTNWVPVDREVTCFVGRNESGKTALLQALWKTWNRGGASFDKLLDFPRDRYTAERNGTQPITELEFALEPGESEALGRLMLVPLDSPPRAVTLRSFYIGESESRTEIHFEPHVMGAMRESVAGAKRQVAALQAALRRAAAGDALERDGASALAALDEARALWSAHNLGVLSRYLQAVDEWSRGATDPASAAEAERAALSELLERSQRGDPAGALSRWVASNLPVFIYLDEYAKLESRIHLPSYLRQVREGDTSPRLRAQRALFAWSKLDPGELAKLGEPVRPDEGLDPVRRRLDIRRTLLESASFSLTGDWESWWSTDAGHRLHFSIDGEYLSLTVSDAAGGAQIPFEERSQGFQWFFSLYLLFLVESRDAHRGAVLLLDEPGLHLHPTLQRRLIGFFDRVASDNQLLFTTHLPFLIDPQRLHRVRTVERLQGGARSTRVWPALRAGGDLETALPIQTAIATEISRSLARSRHTLLVPEVTDYGLLKGLYDVLTARRPERALDDELLLVPCGGAQQLMPLAASLPQEDAQATGLLVLLDGEPLEAEHAPSPIYRGSGVLVLGEAISHKGASSEDLFERSEYAAAAGVAVGRAIDLDEGERTAPTNRAALGRYWRRHGLGAFGPPQRSATALALLDRLARGPEAIEPRTLARAEALFTAIAQRFEDAESSSIHSGGS